MNNWAEIFLKNQLILWHSSCSRLLIASSNPFLMRLSFPDHLHSLPTFVSSMKTSPNLLDNTHPPDQQWLHSLKWDRLPVDSLLCHCQSIVFYKRRDHCHKADLWLVRLSHVIIFQACDWSIDVDSLLWLVNDKNVSTCQPGNQAELVIE